MRPLLKYLLPLLFALNTSAQVNLVPNGSFEDTVLCPSGFGQIERARFWSNPTAASPDFLSTNYCYEYINSDGINVPSNFFGFQNARIGVNYAGIGPFLVDTSFIQAREYIQVTLTEQLKPNQYYKYEFYVSLADQTKRYAMKSLGVKVSMDSLFEINTGQAYTDILSTDIDYQNTNYLNDTVGWQKVSGCFLANGGERFLIIGCFGKYENIDYVIYDNSAMDNGFAYYYIDDVSLYELEEPCAVSIKETPTQQITFFPNPAANILTISTGNLQNAQVELFDISGRKLFQQNLTASQQSIDISGYANGIYIFAVTANGKVVKREKIMVTR